MSEFALKEEQIFEEKNGFPLNETKKTQLGRQQGEGSFPARAIHSPLLEIAYFPPSCTIYYIVYTMSQKSQISATNLKKLQRTKNNVKPPEARNQLKLIHI